MKIAWITDLSTDSVSAHFLNNLLAFFLNDHDLQVFSSSKTSFLGINVENYLTYVPEHHEITIFTLEDTVSSSFVYELAQSYTGIRIFIDSQFNTLKFGKISHITNGIVFDELIESEGYQQAIKIGDYHMRGWSMKPYINLYPISFPNISHGINVLMNYSYEFIKPKSYYLDYPLSLAKIDSAEQCYKVFSIENSKKSLPVEQLRELENGTPFIFVSSAELFGQICVKPGILQKQILDLVIDQIKSDQSILDLLKQNIVNYAVLNSPENVYKRLIEICSENIEMIKFEVKESESSQLIELKKLISPVDEMLFNIMNEFSNRFELSE